jgi:S1-C subfamily serine protease
MTWSQIGAAVLILCVPSYAWSQAPEALLSTPIAPPAAAAAAKGTGVGKTVGPAGRAALAGARRAARYDAALAALKPEGQASTRGVKETEVYRKASPSVVLVVSKGGFGSGALVSADGKIITNLHVVGDDTEVGVIFKPAVEGAKVDEADVRTAKVIRRDAVADLALIQVSETPAGMAPLALGKTADMQVGEDVHAIGHPTGEAWTYTKGIVSQIRHDYVWRADDRLEHRATIIQTQTPINPGNSGGPLIDDELRLVGVNSFIGAGEGLNYAVSADDVAAFLARPDYRLIPAKAVDPNCEEKDLETWRTKDNEADAFLVDADCDNEGDYVVLAPDKKREPLVLLFDDDGDGKVDTIIVDEKRDGKPDMAYYDTDADGEVDLAGEFRNGESEPYRYERLDPEDGAKKPRRRG